MQRMAILIAAVLLCVFALQWDLPPPAAEVSVKLMASIQTANEGVQAEPQALMARNAIEKHNEFRKNPRDGGANLTTRATADWILPPGRASPTEAGLAGTASTIPTTQLQNGGQWEGADNPAGDTRW